MNLLFSIPAPRETCADDYIQFTPRHPNTAKAMTNWERKSSYLLREIGKFNIYVESLEAAQKEKEKIYAERPKVGPAEDTGVNT